MIGTRTIEIPAYALTRFMDTRYLGAALTKIAHDRGLEIQMWEKVEYPALVVSVRGEMNNIEAFALDAGQKELPQNAEII